MLRSIIITLIWILLFWLLLSSCKIEITTNQLRVLSTILGIFGSLLGEILTELKNISNK